MALQVGPKGEGRVQDQYIVGEDGRYPDATEGFQINAGLRIRGGYGSQGDDNGSKNTMLREVFSRDLQGATGQPYTRSRYYHLYLNGQYWGIYETHERSEARYAASYFGYSSEDYDVVKVDSGPSRPSTSTPSGCTSSLRPMRSTGCVSPITSTGTSSTTAS